MLQLCLKIRFKNLYSLIRQHYGPISVQTRSFSQLKAEPSCGLIRFSVFKQIFSAVRHLWHYVTRLCPRTGFGGTCDTEVRVGFVH